MKGARGPGSRDQALSSSSSGLGLCHQASEEDPGVWEHTNRTKTRPGLGEVGGGTPASDEAGLRGQFPWHWAGGITPWVRLKSKNQVSCLQVNLMRLLPPHQSSVSPSWKAARPTQLQKRRQKGRPPAPPAPRAALFGVCCDGDHEPRQPHLTDGASRAASSPQRSTAHAHFRRGRQEASELEALHGSPPSRVPQRTEDPGIGEGPGRWGVGAQAAKRRK